MSNTSKRKPGCDSKGQPLTDHWDAPPEYLQLTISDCSRSVNFSLDWETAADRRASLHKVDRMIEALTSFREGLVEEQRLYADRVKHIKKKRNGDY